MLVVILVTVYMRICELGTSDQAPKSRAAKQNSDCGKSLKASIPSTEEGDEDQFASEPAMR